MFSKTKARIDDEYVRPVRDAAVAGYRVALAALFVALVALLVAVRGQ